MRIGILGPSKSVRNKAIISKLAKIVADSKYEIVVCADKDSSTEFFAKEYIKNKGKKIYSIVPLDDKEFGYSWVNTKLGEVINCGTWRIVGGGLWLSIGICNSRSKFFSGNNVSGRDYTQA